MKLLQIYLCYLWLVLCSRVTHVCRISVKLFWNIVYCENAVQMILTVCCVFAVRLSVLCLRSISSNCSFYDWQVRRLAPAWHVEAEQKQQGVEVRMEWNPTGCRCKSAGACLREWRVWIWPPAGGCGWCGKACRCGSYQRNTIHPNLKICWKCTNPQTIQDVDECVSSSEYIWRNLALEHLLTNGSSAVNGCRQNESPNSWYFN